MIKRASKAVGIDLGTTYSALAYLDENRTPCIISDSNGQAVIPSVVFFDDQRPIVGQDALDLSKDRSDRVAQFIKIHMGDDWKFPINGRDHSPESLSAIILAHLVREAELQLEPIRDAVITVPAWFTEKRRRATEQAGRIAGLNVIGTLNEPTAAALAYGLHCFEGVDGKKEQNILVYDLGGGTFDITVMRITPSEIRELATLGNRKLGGKDWDERLMGLALDAFAKEKGVDLRLRSDAASSIHELRIECEKAKRRLSQTVRTAIPVRALGLQYSFEVTREQFEKATSGLLMSTRVTTETALRDAGLGWDKVDHVVLVGGSSHMPMVRNMLQQVSGRPPARNINPVTAVAQGAAVYAHLLETKSGPREIIQKQDAEEKSAPTTSGPPTAVPRAKPISQSDDVMDVLPAGPIHKDEIMDVLPVGPSHIDFVTAHGVGIRHRRNDGVFGNTVLIPKNTLVPAQRSQVYKTVGAAGANRIRIVVTQGDTTNVELAEVLGTATITGIPPNEPAGQPVQITMRFDEQSRLHLDAEYLKTKQKLRLDLEIPGGLREEQVREYRDFMVSSGLIKPIDDEDDAPYVDLELDDDQPPPPRRK